MRWHRKINTDAARQVTGRVNRRRQGDMRRRWCACGLLRAEQGFHHVKGHRDLPNLIGTLATLTGADHAELAKLDEQRDAA